MIIVNINFKKMNKHFNTNTQKGGHIKGSDRLVRYALYVAKMRE